MSKKSAKETGKIVRALLRDNARFAEQKKIYNITMAMRVESAMHELEGYGLLFQKEMLDMLCKASKLIGVEFLNIEDLRKFIEAK